MSVSNSRVAGIVLLALCLSVPHALGAQTPSCEEGFIRLDDAIDLHLQRKRLAEAAAQEPLAAPSAQQIAAPASVEGGGSEVSRPGFPSLLGLAYESGLVEAEEGVTTVSLTPFSFLSLLKPEYSHEQLLYQGALATQLRRIGGSVSFGGEGESFDRDGDGTTDEALKAEDLDDIVTWELRWQFYGSRDRRDPGNFKIFDDKVKESFSDSFTDFGDLIMAMDPSLVNLDQGPANSRCFRPSDLMEVFHKPDVVAVVQRLRLSDIEYEEAAQEAFEQIDNKLILTLVYGGTERARDFGSDKQLAALRGAWGPHLAEVSWSETESLLEAPDAVVWKFGYGYSRLFLKGSELSKDGVTLTLSGSYEMLEDVPMAMHDEIGKVNIKVDVPLSEGLSIPVSVTWANHADLLTDEDEIRGHIGLTVNFSTIQEQLVARRGE